VLLTFRVRLYRNILAIYTRLYIYDVYIISSSAVEIVNYYFTHSIEIYSGLLSWQFV